MTISQIETELAQAAGIKLPKKTLPAGPKRNSYLESLLGAVGKLPDDVWESLSESAALWASNATTAVNSGEEIPDFSDLPAEETPVEAQAEPESEIELEPEPELESEPESVKSARKRTVTERKPRATKVNLIGTIEKWEQEAAKYEQQLAEIGARHRSVLDRLDAIRNVVTQFNGEPKAPKAPKEPKVAGSSNGAARGGLANSIVEIVSASDAPLSRKELKSRLLGLGYPEDKLGPNFYVSINRLKQRNLVHVSSDGELSAA